MTTPTTHDAGAPEIAGDADSLPSHAELVRTLLGPGGVGSLTTLATSGHPYGSLATFSVLDDGSPLLCISELAEHTRNARRHRHAGLLVTAAPDHTGRDPLDRPRASILGDLTPYEVTAADIDAHLAVHPNTADYMDFADFRWWCLAVVSARFVGGFGSMSWVDGSAIAAAQADPVLPHARPAIEHMNGDHADANLLLARDLALVESATAASVDAIDRHGITLVVETPSGACSARLAFPTGPLEDPSQIRSAVVQLVERARDAGSVR